MKNLKMLCVVITSLVISAFAAQANAFNNIYVFGDSLSDNGNLSMAPGAPAGTPARFTNGPVAVEIVAGALGLPLIPSNHLNGGYSGNNFAVAGAKAIDEDGNEQTPDINLPTQVNAFLQINGGTAPADALYIVLIGGNDIRAAREIRAAAVFAATAQERQAIREAANASLTAAVESEQAQIEKLIAAGAVNILVSNAPDIGVIPETELVSLGLQANTQTNQQLRKAIRLPKVATKLSAKYNRKLARKLARIEHRTGVDIIEYDLFSFLTDQLENAEDYGFTNTTEPCIYVFSQGGTINPECSDFPIASGFLFWDEIHPTTAAHQGAGAEIVQTLLAQ